MDNKTYDYIIIGAGIASLYTAYKIKQIKNNYSILILEKNKQIGGRLGNYLFYGENVATGAGIVRKNKDKLLLKLINELKIKINEFNIKYNYSIKINNKVDIIKEFNKLKKKYNGEHETFKKFATKIFGDKLYKDFLISSGYTDYEKEDVFDVLNYYGMEDNKCCYTGISIHWDELIEKLSIKVGLKNIKTSIDIIKINNISNYFKIITKSGLEFNCNKIIIATTIDAIKNLLPKYEIYNNINYQNFIKLYGKFDKKSSLIMKEYAPVTTIVPSILQKILPINSEKGIYMISYSDNKNAVLVNKYSDNTEINRIKL